MRFQHGIHSTIRRFISRIYFLKPSKAHENAICVQSNFSCLLRSAKKKTDSVHKKGYKKRKSWDGVEWLGCKKEQFAEAKC